MKIKLTLALLGLALMSSTLWAKDHNIRAYTDRGIKYYPHYVQKGVTKIGKASWYGRPFHQRLTASGERYNMYQMTAAHKTYALNTVLKVTNLTNKKSVKVRVNDRGPFKYRRDIDLSYGAAKKLGFVKKGVEKVKIEVLSSPKKGKYQAAKITQATPKRKHKVQIASFFNHQSAKAFTQKHQLKNTHIIKKYLPSEKKTAYRVIVKCTPWEAKNLINSKKFDGAFIVS